MLIGSWAKPLILNVNILSLQTFNFTRRYHFTRFSTTTTTTNLLKDKLLRHALMLQPEPYKA